MGREATGKLRGASSGLCLGGRVGWRLQYAGCQKEGRTADGVDAINLDMLEELH